LLERDKAYVDRLAKYRCMNNAKWRKFFLAAIGKLKEIEDKYQIIGGKMVCKSLRDPIARHRRVIRVFADSRKISLMPRRRRDYY
jgi:hypothetical protein